MKSPGRVIKLADGRIVILYNKQPEDLVKAGRREMYLVDENIQTIFDENNKPKKILVTTENWKEVMKGANVFGYFD